MSITFRVTSDDDFTNIPAAQITIRQLARFRNFASEHRIPVDEIPGNDDISATLSFEASICGFALAILARIFDMAEPAIAVIDEAQFRQRQVRFYKSDTTGEPMMTLSDTINGSIARDCANANAFAVI